MRLCDVNKVCFHPPPAVTEWPSWHTSRAFIKSQRMRPALSPEPWTSVPLLPSTNKNGFSRAHSHRPRGLSFYTLGRLMFEYFNRGRREIGDLESFRKMEQSTAKCSIWDSLRSKSGLFIIAWEILKVSQQVVDLQAGNVQVMPQEMLPCVLMVKVLFGGLFGICIASFTTTIIKNKSNNNNNNVNVNYI